MSVVAIANQKGGVGKTTTTISLAALAAADGERQLVVDLDPQASLTTYLGHDPEAGATGIHALFEAARAGAEPSAADVLVETGVGGIDLIPATTLLATLERRLGSLAGMGRVVGRSLAPLSGRYGHIWIDCPPALGILMVNALAACDRLLIPVQTEFLALKGLERMLASLEMIQRSRGVPLPYTIVPTMYDRRTRASIDSLEALQRRYGEHLSPQPIPIDTQFRMASEQGLPLPDVRREARGVVAYRELLAQLFTDTAMASETMA